MTESTNQLIQWGWERTLAFAQDVAIVDKMRCNHMRCHGPLMLETWHNNLRTKQFTRCCTCGHREPF